MFYTGAIQRPAGHFEDQLPVFGGNGVEIDWEKGWDIRNYLGVDISFKNQKISLSCVGQAWSYYAWVKQIAELKQTDSQLQEVEQFSAKAIYSQIALPGGGAYIDAGGKVLINWGAIQESKVSSYVEGSTNEKWMKDRNWMNDYISELAKIYQGSSLHIISARTNMDLFADAIKNNLGAVGGVNGNNYSGWGSERPQPPNQVDWGHALYFGAFGEDEKGKFIATPNSWGNMFNKSWQPGKPPGYGWQKLYQNYFNTDYMFDPFTYVDKPNNMENDFVKIVKDKNSPAVGFWIPATKPEALQTMALAFNKKIEKKEDGSIDWDKTIEGELTIN